MADADDRDDEATCFTTRISSFRDRARESERAEPRPPKLPPPPGPLPAGGAVDPDDVLNRKE